jgi:hypothetical protein
MRLDSLGKPYLVQAIQNSGKPPANLAGNSISLKQAEATAEDSSTPTQEQSLGRVLEFISKQRRQQKKDPKERGKLVVEEYKRVETHRESGEIDLVPKGRNLNIKA